MSSGWKLYKTYKANNSDSGAYTRYWLRLSISRKGTFRFKGITAPSSSYAAATSASSKTLTVK